MTKIMKLVMWFGVLGVLGLGVQARADEEGTGVEIVVGGKFEDDADAQLLVEVTFGGIEAAQGVKYFWVSGGLISERDEFELEKLELKVVPYSKENEEAHRTFRALPVDYLRYLDLGIEHSVTLRAVGWSVEAEKNLTSDGRLEGFAELTLDMLGVQYIRLMNGEQFTGFELGKVEVETGLSWNFSDATKLQLIAEAGFNGSANRTGVALSPELAAKVQFLFDALRTHFVVFAEAEYERLDLVTDSPFSKGEFEIKLGAGIRL